MNIKSLSNPLSSSMSEVYTACICELYSSFYGPKADYSAVHTQESLKSLIHSILDSEEALCNSFEIFEKKAKSTEIFNQLVKSNWLEAYEDKAALIKLYRFTKEGKVLAQTLFELTNGFYTRKSRSVRSTKSSLESFYKERNVDYLLDAWSYSMQIMQEFEDLINEIHEKRKQLLQSMATSEAVELFLQEMQKKERDLQQKLKTDSVLRYSEAIHTYLDKIQFEFPLSFWQSVNPQIVAETGNVFVNEENPGFFITTKIREHIEVAIEKKNPELTQALNFFVKRTRSLLKTTINLSSSQEGLHEALSKFKSFDPEIKENALNRLAIKFKSYKTRIYSFEGLAIPKRIKREVHTGIENKLIDQYLQNRSSVKSKLNEKMALSSVLVKNWIKEKAKSGNEIKLETEDVNHVMGVLKSMLILDGMKANNMIGIVDNENKVEGLVTASLVTAVKEKELKRKLN